MVSGFDLDGFLPYRLAVLAAKVSDGFSQHYRSRYGIGVAEWRVVAHLSQETTPVSVREICRRVDLDKPKVSRAASRLEAAGYVSKAVNAQDRRLVALELTAKGRAMIDELAPLARDYERALEAALGPDSRAFYDCVHKLTAALEIADG